MLEQVILGLFEIGYADHDWSAPELKYIKKVYRNLARKNHPDIVRAKGITDKSLIQKAKENFQRINDAYEQILKIRGEK